MYRLIALDLDGTLLGSDMKVSERNAEALEKAMAAGIQVVYATTRWYALAKRTADRTNVTTPLICSNGAVIRNADDGTELLHLTVDPDAAREVVTLGDDEGWEMYTTVGDATYMKMRPGVVPERLPAGLKVAERQSDHCGEGDVTSVIVYGSEAVAAIKRDIEPRHRGKVRFNMNRPPNSQHYVVINHVDSDKGRALDVVCRQLGVLPREAVAMGDSESDLGMLEMAGLGIAMANSPDEVKRAALHVTRSNDEDGVAWALEKFVL